MKVNAFVKSAAAAAVTALTLCGCFSAYSADIPAGLPVIVTQPSDIMTSVGEYVSFEVAAKGDGLSYQWYYKKAYADAWTMWNDHNTAKTSAPVNDTWSGMRVYCRVSDRHGHSVASRVARIMLEKPLSITGQPRDVILKPGETAYFSVDAKGQGLKYQWYYRKGDSRLWVRWKGHTESVTSAVANISWRQMKVCCVVTDRAGVSAISRPASITIVDSPTVISQTQIADSSGSVSFSAVGGTEGLVYQWFFVPEGMPWGVKMVGRTENTLTLDSIGQWENAQVYCRLKCPGGSMICTPRLTVSEYGTPDIVLSYSAAANHKIAAEVIDKHEKAKNTSYQWYLRPKGSLGSIKLSGKTGSKISLAPSSLTGGSELFCRVSYDNSGRHESDSQSVELPDSRQPVILSQPEDAVVSSGVPVKLSVKAEGNGLQYQWYIRRKGDLGWLRLVGQTGGTFTGVPDSSWHGMQVICRVSDENGRAAYSRPVSLAVSEEFALCASPANVTSRSGKSTTFSVTAKGRSLDYQWFRRAYRSESWERWEGMTGSSISLPAETDWHKMTVRCDVRDCTGRVISSDSAKVWITDALDILRQPRGITVGVYEPAEFSVKAQGKGLRYQWYYKKKGMRSWRIWKKHRTSVTGAISNPTWDGMKVMCVVTDRDGNKIQSQSAKVTIMHTEKE